MVSQYGIKLAVHLITNHFGNLVSKVCETLLRRGVMTWEELVRFTELTKEQVKNSLLVLIQHNCVQAFVEERDARDGVTVKTSTQYLAVFDNIIHRLRFPKFLDIVYQELDTEDTKALPCGKVLAGILKDGRLTLSQIVDRLHHTEGKHVNESLVKERLGKLLSARYAERCPAPDPVLHPVAKEEGTAKKRGAKAAKLEREVPVTLEQRVLAAAVPMDAIRFSLVSSAESLESTGTSPNNSPQTSVGEKRKRDASDMDKESNAAGDESTLWRANFEEFVRHLRDKACVENVRTRMDDGAATVLNAILDKSRTSDRKVKLDNSVPFPLSIIFEEVMKSEAGRTMTLDRVRASLVQLGCPQRMPNDSFSIDLKGIIELARNEEVESTVLKRYGRDAYRIFRLLSKDNRLIETDAIAESSLVEKKDTLKSLYMLWKDEYLHMEKLVLVGARQTQWLLWKVNKPALWEHVLDEMYHAALNLSLRFAHEEAKAQEVMDIPLEEWTGPIREKCNRVRKVMSVLEISLMKLDEAMMLFHDF